MFQVEISVIKESKYVHYILGLSVKVNRLIVDAGYMFNEFQHKS